MHHIEGFVDGQSYFSTGHIINVTMKYEGNVCFIWLLSKETMAIQKVIYATQKLEEWVEEELSGSLKAGQAAIQRKMNRLRGNFIGDTADVICVYYKGHIYTYGEQKGSYKGYQKPFGIYVWPKDREWLCKMEEYGNLPQKAHCLKGLLLKALSEGKMTQGFFLLWEDIADV